MSIEGIPYGWDAVRYDHANKGESFLNGRGEIILHIYDTPSPRKRLIVRKIEKPKRYRPFANAAEAEPFWDKKLRMKESLAKEPGKAMFRINAIGDEDVSIGFQVYGYQSAFDIYECIDGTPFGIEVTE